MGLLSRLVYSGKQHMESLKFANFSILLLCLKFLACVILWLCSPVEWMAKPKPHQILYLAGVESIIRLLHWRVGGLLLYSSGSHLHIDTPSTLYTRGWNSNLTYLLNALHTTPKKEWTLWPCYVLDFLKSIHIHWQTCSFYEIFSAF